MKGLQPLIDWLHAHSLTVFVVGIVASVFSPDLRRLLLELPLQRFRATRRETARMELGYLLTFRRDPYRFVLNILSFLGRSARYAFVLATLYFFVFLFFQTFEVAVMVAATALLVMMLNTLRMIGNDCRKLLQFNKYAPKLAETAGVETSFEAMKAEAETRRRRFYYDVFGFQIPEVQAHCPSSAQTARTVVPEGEDVEDSLHQPHVDEHPL